MKAFQLALLVVTIGLFLSVPCRAQIQYDYTFLRDKEMLDMQKIIEQPYAELRDQMDSGSFDAADYLAEFQSATRIAMSRPDYDSTRSTAFAPTYTLLREFNIVESVVARLVDEAIAGIQAAKTSPADKTTYMVVLENVIYEFKPLLPTNPEIRKAFEKIRDGQLKVDEKTKSYQLLRSMKIMRSPSLLAQTVLKQLDQRAPNSKERKKEKKPPTEAIDEATMRLKAPTTPPPEAPQSEPKL